VGKTLAGVVAVVTVEVIEGMEIGS